MVSALKMFHSTRNSFGANNTTTTTRSSGARPFPLDKSNSETSCGSDNSMDMLMDVEIDDNSSLTSNESDFDDECSTSADCDDNDNMTQDDPIPTSSALNTTVAPWKCPYTIIPQFYFPGKRNCVFNQPATTSTTRKHQEIMAMFACFQNQTMSDQSFLSVITRDVLHWPSYCNNLLIQRVSGGLGKGISCSAFIHYWEQEIVPYDHTEGLFRLLKQPHNNCIKPEDMKSLISVVAKNHPSLHMLHENDHLCEKYVTAVMTRFFYTVNTARTGKITLREFRQHGHLFSILHALAIGACDINEERRYFSYEHFLVCYCTFMDLDQDHDEYIHIREIQRYQRFAFTPVLVNR